MERDRTSTLIAHDRLTADQAETQVFPSVLRGFDRDTVEEFQRRVARELRAAHEETARMAEELRQAKVTAEIGSLDTGDHAVDILQRTTLQADRILADAQADAHKLVDEAKEEYERIMAEARERFDAVMADAAQQARQLVARARADAQRGADKIRAEAPAEAQRIVAHYTQLAASIRAGLQANLGAFGEQVQDWVAKAQEGPEPPAAARSPRRRQPS